MIIAPASSFKDINPFTTIEGRKTWVHTQGDKYVVTGVDCYGKRFRIESENWFHARCVNLFRGTRWLLRAGKRWKIGSVFN